MKPQQRRDILAVALLILGLFLALALLPVSILGERAQLWFPSGNVVGRVGLFIQGRMSAALGLSAGLLPPLLWIVGMRLGGWMKAPAFRRMVTLVGASVLMLPVLLFIVPLNPAFPGWLGAAVGIPMVQAVGRVGTFLILFLIFVVLSITVVGWNPLHPIQVGLGQLLRGTRWAVESGWSGGRARWDAWQEDRTRRAEQAAVEAEAARAAEASSNEKSLDTPSHTDPFEGSPAGEVEAGTSQESFAPSHAEDVAGQGGKGGKRGKAGQTSLFPDPMDPRELEGAVLPPSGLLSPPQTRDREGMDRELEAMGQVLVEKLKTFNVETRLTGRTTGPVVTQFEVEPAPGVKVNRIANLEADLALAMKARSIRIVAPIPGKGAVGVEVPNPRAEAVALREILEARPYLTSRAELPLALGKNLMGTPYVSDLAKMPHLLIAGATGSGKSVCLNTIITSLVYRHTPETLRLLLIDPKMVELSTYADLPHLRHPVVTDPREAAGVLKWAVLEMERRYTLLSANGVRSLAEFNRRVKNGVPLRKAVTDAEEGDADRWIYDEGVLPLVVLVIDELADLMMTVQAEVEKPLTQLAQKARAIGIHLIVATQRPSVNVITGLIKANFPTRIAFRVASKTDSRTILDQNGADALLGNGDMLFLPPGQSSPVRIQGAYISTEDTEALVGWYREESARRVAEAAQEGHFAQEEEDILELVRVRDAQEAGGGDEDGFFNADWDEQFQEAAEVCIQNQQGSTSLLQRKLRIGYGRAARIVDQLHDAGILGPPDGSKPREVLMGLDEFHAFMQGKDLE
ncbi:MAG: DNA translocase FtsK [Gemmatimonadota bacterium]